MAKKKAIKVKRDAAYDPDSEPDFHENAVVMDEIGQIIDPLKHLKLSDEHNYDKIAREKEDEKEMAMKIASLANANNIEYAEKPAHIQAASKKATTEGQKIWEEIKNLPIQMFALPNKCVYEFCKPLDLVPSMCFLQQSFSSVLPMLEMAIGNAYTCEMQGKYIVVKRAVKSV